MPIDISCTCGKSFKVKDSLGGRRAKCPGCGSLIEIPHLHGETACFCGNVISFPPEKSGTMSTCPKCDRSVFLTDQKLMLELEVETESKDIWPRCPGCSCRIIDTSTSQCVECGANLRSGKINYRAAMPRARGVGRAGRPSNAPPVAPIARVASSAQPMATSQSSGAARGGAGARNFAAEPPPPAAMPPIDSGLVDWQDSDEARVAEDLVEEQAAELGERASDLDFSPGSLSILDFVFDRKRAEGALLSEFVVGSAAYIGEVITRNVGGRWRSAKDGRRVIANLPGGVSFDALGQVKKRVPSGQGSFVQLFLELMRSLPS